MTRIFFSLGKGLILSLLLFSFMVSPLSALEDGSLYYSEEEIHLLEELNLDDVIREAQSGDAVSQYQQASISYLGLGGEKDPAVVVTFFKKAAEQGHTLACRKMGLLAHFGDIVEKDIPEALRWYTMAHENGDGDAEILIGLVYLYDQEDSEEAVRWFKIAAENNKTLAYFLVGEAAYISGDTEDALSWYALAAEKGHRIASVRLGNIYYDKRNFEKGVEWLNAEPAAGSDEGISLESQVAVYKEIWGNFSKVAAVNKKVLLAREKIVVTPFLERKEPKTEKKSGEEKSRSVVPAVEKESEKGVVAKVQEPQAQDDTLLFDEKRQFFQEIINGKEKAKKLLQKSHLSLQNHDWSEAIRTASEAMDLHPDYADAYNNRAWGYYEKGLLDESIADCNRALAIDGNHFFALNNRGRALQKKGDISAALQDYDAACLKGLEAACENFKKITRLSPEEEIRFLLAKSGEELAAQSADSIIDATSRLISLDIHKKEAYSRRCGAHVVKGMLEEAYPDCSEAILLDPDNAGNYISLGVVFEQQGDLESALLNYRISCELKNATGCQSIVRLDAEKREAAVAPPVVEPAIPVMEEAEKEIDTAPAEDTVVEKVEDSLLEVNVPALLEKSRGEFASQNYDAVIEMSSLILLVDSQNVEAYSNRCGARSMKNLYKDAQDDCLKAVEIDPEFSMGYNNLGWVFEQQEDMAAALSRYNKSCDLGNSLGCQNYQRLSDK